MEARPSKICQLGGDGQSLTSTLLRQQHLMTRYGMAPTFAAIAAEFIFDGGRA